MTASILITGADGFIGSRIAARLLDESDASLVLCVRAADAAAFETKKSRLSESLRAGRGNVEFHRCELTGEHPFRSVSGRNVRHIIHSAAVTRFNVDADTARRVNIEGTEKVLKFAESCPGLETLDLLSSIYASGLRTGPIEETPLEHTGFANHYERSKWESESLLLERYSHLPWRILRIATAIADDSEGRVSRYNAVHNTLQLLFYGLITTIPGEPGTPLYFVSGDFVARIVCSLGRGRHTGRIFHLTHRREQGLTLDQFIESVFEIFETDDLFRKRRIPRPLYMDQEAFGLLHSALGAFAGGVVNQAMDSVAPFAPQLFIAKDVQNANLVETLGNDPAPDIPALVRTTCRYLVRTKWGRDASERA